MSSIETFRLSLVVSLLLLWRIAGLPANGFADELPLAAARACQQESKLPKDMMFEPEWRDRGDCGPLALYVLMRLNGHDVSLDSVKQVLFYDPDVGCSLADVARAGDKLGFPTRLQFVSPVALQDLPHPYVVHAIESLDRGTGHFIVIVGHDKQKRLFSVIDTTFHRFREQTEDSLMIPFSGYVLSPAKVQESEFFRYVISIELFGTGCILAILYWFPARRSKRVDAISSVVE